MPYLIDGHNLIGKTPELSLKALDDEMELVKLLQAYCLVSRKSAEVYFDGALPGYAGTRRYGMVKAHFIRQGQTADEALIARLRRLGRQAVSWWVVSSDRQVQAEARTQGARVISSEEFGRLMLTTNRPSLREAKSDLEKLSEDEIREWLDVFGEKGDGIGKDDL